MFKCGGSSWTAAMTCPMTFRCRHLNSLANGDSLKFGDTSGFRQEKKRAKTRDRFDAALIHSVASAFPAVSMALKTENPGRHAIFGHRPHYRPANHCFPDPGCTCRYAEVKIAGLIGFAQHSRCVTRTSNLPVTVSQDQRRSAVYVEHCRNRSGTGPTG